MKRMLIELDDRTARDLERVAPSRARKRAEFVRSAIRQAIDRALEDATQAAYRRMPVRDGHGSEDAFGWDAENRLARPSRGARGSKQSKRSKRAKKAA